MLSSTQLIRMRIVKKSFNTTLVHNRQLQTKTQSTPSVCIFRNLNKRYSINNNGFGRRLFSTEQKQAKSSGKADKISNKGGSAAAGEGGELTTITFAQGAKAGVQGTAIIGISALLLVSGFYIVKELMPTKMSPHTVFNSAFEVVKTHPEVTSRLGSDIKGYGMDLNTRKEGRRNTIANDVYTDDDGVKRMRIKFNVEGSEGKGVVYAEVSKEMKSGEFAYIILQTRLRGREEAVSLIDNRRTYTLEEQQEKIANRLATIDAKLYGHSNCQWTKRQLNELGDFHKKIKVYLCDEPEHKSECEKVQLQGFPSWVIANEVVGGFKSLDDLRAIARQL